MQGQVSESSDEAEGIMVKGGDNDGGEYGDGRSLKGQEFQRSNGSGSRR